MVNINLDAINVAGKTSSNPREVTADLASVSAREMQPSPLASLASSHPVARQTAALELSLSKIFDVIDNSVAVSGSPIQRALREVLSADGVSVSYPQIKDREASLQIKDRNSGTTLQFSWGGIEGEQLILKNSAGKELLYVDVRRASGSDQQIITLKRVDDCNIIAINDSGVRVCDSRERQAYLKLKSDFVLQRDSSPSLSEKAADFLHSVSAGRFGSGIKIPSAPELPGRVIPHNGLLDYFTQLNQLLEKATTILTPVGIME